MTIKVQPLVPCGSPKCKKGAEYLITFTTHRGQLPGPKVCFDHINWGKKIAKQMEDS